MSEKPLNVLMIGHNTYLIARAADGDLSHFVPEAKPGETHQAATSRLRLASRDARAALRAETWRGTTLCGIDWDEMADESEASTASCRQCQSAIDRRSPEEQHDRRLPVVVQAAADSIVAHGHTEIHNVPGNYQDALRRLTRAEVKTRTGHGCRTWAREGIVVIVCEPVRASHEAEGMRQAADILDAHFTGTPGPVVDQSFRLYWETPAAE
jgi:hypothetical protein